MKKMSRNLVAFCLSVFCILSLSSCEWKKAPSDPARFIAIQHNGRVKPLDAFARQVVEFVTSKERFNHEAPVTTLLDALATQDRLAEKQWIRINHLELLKTLGLPSDRHYFSYEEVLPSVTQIESLVRSAKTKRDKDLRPDALEQAAEGLYSRLVTVKEIMTGEIIRTLPPAEGSEWQSAYFSIDPKAADFKKIVALFGEKKFGLFASAVDDWNRTIRESTLHGDFQKIVLEVHYLRLRPFEISWMLYLAAFLCLVFFKKIRAVKIAGLALIVAAVFFHTYGLALRVIVLSRPPVSNMYESMVFMNWALIVFALIFSLTNKNITFLTTGAAISALVMIYGNLLPIDTSLEVLVPVLRSNYWLTIHVMTIVSSYGAFGLAMALGHRHLALHALKKFHSKKSEDTSAQLIYRVIQLGVLLLGIGTVLGGVWANESWGRFWGWDPKETWALITFLGYLVVVHLKHAKKISDFGLALSSVVGFLLVLMTWYGVNFVLGRGLHSYGSGSGGMIWVTYYLIFEAVFVGWTLLAGARRLKS